MPARDPDVLQGIRQSSWIRRRLTARGRSLIITRAGWLFCLLTLAVGFAAINSGSNLLHAFFGAQMALFLGTAILSEGMVRRIAATRLPTSDVHALTPTPMRVVLRNMDSEADVLSISVEDDDRVTTRGRAGPVFSVRVAAGASVTLPSTVTMPRRGRMRLPPAVVSTRFPFGLFVKMRELPIAPEIVVYPRVHFVDLHAGGGDLPGLEQADESIQSLRTSRAGEFFGLREYREGDELRRIHWPAVARQGRTIVREHEAEGHLEIVLTLHPGQAGSDAFEREVERVASLTVAVLQRGDVAVGLRYGKTLVVEPATGAEQRRTILEHLALIGEPEAT